MKADDYKPCVDIVGIVGVPAKYGGFETLVENLLDYLPEHFQVRVFCSSKEVEIKKTTYKNSKLTYIPLAANGVSSVLYDALSLVVSLCSRSSFILVLGVSGAVFIPVLKLLRPTKIIITNIDGLEWKRDKWNVVAASFLRFSEKIAVKFSDIVIGDNEVICEYVLSTYGVDAVFIPYGGDASNTNNAISKDSVKVTKYRDKDYYLKICRIEPENNVMLVLNAFSEMDSENLVIVGNWESSGYGKDLKSKYSEIKNIQLIDPVYDVDKIHYIRTNAKGYVHGHSAGGTNPSLVEAMNYSLPVIAFNCLYNRSTTENCAFYFESHLDIKDIVENTSQAEFDKMGHQLGGIAKHKYVWNRVAAQYLELFRSVTSKAIKGSGKESDTRA